MKALTLSMLAALLAAVVVSAADIKKWRTPDGGLYFGDRPPPGSTLLETIPEGESVSTVQGEVTKIDDSLDKAAADGREIMRRRAAEREAALDRYAESPPTVVEAPETERNLIIINEGFGHRRFHHRDDFVPSSGGTFALPQSRTMRGPGGTIIPEPPIRHGEMPKPNPPPARPPRGSAPSGRIVER